MIDVEARARKIEAEIEVLSDFLQDKSLTHAEREFWTARLVKLIGEQN